MRTLPPVLVLLATVVAHIEGKPPFPGPLTLRLFVSHRFEGQIVPFHNEKAVICTDEEVAKDECVGGFAQVATLTDRFRASHPSGVVLSLGGNLATTSLFMRTFSDAFPRAYSRIGVDATALTHRDFYITKSNVRAVLETGLYPVVTTNIDLLSEPSVGRYVSHSKFVDTSAGLRVGILHFYTSKLEDQTTMQGVMLLNDFSSLTAEAVRLVEGLDCHVIVLMIKVREAPDNDGDIEWLREFVAQVPHVSVAVTDLASNSPTILDLPYGRKVAHVFCPDSECRGGEHVSEAVVEFSGDGMPLNASVEFTRVASSIPAASRVTELINPIRDQLLDELLTPIAQTSEDLQGDRVPCRFDDCNLGALLCISMIDYVNHPARASATAPAFDGLRRSWNGTSPPLVVPMVNAGFIRASISQPSITPLNIDVSFPFQNDLHFALLSGGTVFAALNHSFDGYEAFSASRRGKGGFLQLYNLEVEFNTRQFNIHDVQVVHEDGVRRRLEYNKLYLVAVPSWIAQGGDDYAVFEDVENAWNATGSILGDVFEDYIRAIPGGAVDTNQLTVPRIILSEDSEYALACPAGWTQPNTPFVCGPCPPFQYKGSETRCDTCEPGFFSEEGASECQITPTETEVQFSRSTTIALVATSSVLVFLSLVVLVLMFRVRKVQMIKMSSPIFMYIIVVGAIFGFVAIATLSVNTSAACMGWLWPGVVSWSLVFGSLCVKLYRTHRIFNLPGSGVKDLTDKLLLARLGALIAADLIILTIWTTVHPIGLDEQRDAFEDGRRIVIAKRCDGEHMFIYGGIVGILKGALAVYGARLAVRTRKVTLRDMRDSKMVGLSIYNIIIVLVVTLPVVLFLNAREFGLEVVTTIIAAAVYVSYVGTVILVVGVKLFLIYVKKMNTMGEKEFGNGTSTIRRRGTTVDSSFAPGPDGLKTTSVPRRTPMSSARSAVDPSSEPAKSSPPPQKPPAVASSSDAADSSATKTGEAEKAVAAAVDAKNTESASVPKGSASGSDGADHEEEGNRAARANDNGANSDRTPPSKLPGAVASGAADTETKPAAATPAHAAPQRAFATSRPSPLSQHVEVARGSDVDGGTVSPGTGEAPIVNNSSIAKGPAVPPLVTVNDIELTTEE